MKNVILTSCDYKHADFVFNHWLRSLEENVKLDNTDVYILGYDLTDKQAEKFHSNTRIKLVQLHSNGDRINIIRRRDSVPILASGEYDQALVTDGGDIVFQSDIDHLFYTEPTKIRGVSEGSGSMFADFFVRESFRGDIRVDVRSALHANCMMNAGVLFGKAGMLAEVFSESLALLNDYRGFGRDQASINYVIHRRKVAHFIDETYNFIPVSAKSKFFIKKGIFLNNEGEKITIVHNAGRKDAFRSIRNFGYGKDSNRSKAITLNLSRLVYNALGLPILKHIFLKLHRKAKKGLQGNSKSYRSDR